MQSTAFQSDAFDAPMQSVQHGTMGQVTLSYAYDPSTNLVRTITANNQTSSTFRLTLSDATGLVRATRAWAPGESAAMDVLALNLGRLQQQRGRLAPIVVMDLGN